MLFSLNGDGTNGPESGRFDTLPAGWGLSLSSDFVDLDSFGEIQLVEHLPDAISLRSDEPRGVSDTPRNDNERAAFGSSTDA